MNLFISCAFCPYRSSSCGSLLREILNTDDCPATNISENSAEDRVINLVLGPNHEEELVSILTINFCLIVKKKYVIKCKIKGFIYNMHPLERASIIEQLLIFQTITGCSKKL